MKTCTKCGITKDEGEFHKDKTSKSGISGICKKCRNDAFKKWREENLEKQKVRCKKWKEANLEKVKENNKKRREANPEKIKEAVNRWREANPEKIKEQGSRWREESDAYPAYLISLKYQIPKSEITPEMIRLKKIELENKRLLKQLKNETK